MITARQGQYLSMYANGARVGQIADTETVSPSTVIGVMRKARDSMGARSLTHAVALGIGFGYLTIGLDGQVKAAEDLPIRTR